MVIQKNHIKEKDAAASIKGKCDERLENMISGEGWQVKFQSDQRSIDHSYLKASAGLLVAALQLCQLTVSKTIPKVKIPDRTNIHQLSSVLYAKEYQP